MPINGVRVESTSTRYRTRDILIVVSEGKNHYLLKNAYYFGYSFRVGSPDSISITTFRSEEYLSCTNYAFLMNLPDSLVLSKFRVFCPDLIDLTGRKSLQRQNTEEKYCIELSKEAPTETVRVGKRNIKKISLSDYWHYHYDPKEKHASIDFNGCIEIELVKSISLASLKDYVNELMIFLQLYAE